MRPNGESTPRPEDALALVPQDWSKAVAHLDQVIEAVVAGDWQAVPWPFIAEKIAAPTGLDIAQILDGSPRYQTELLYLLRHLRRLLLAHGQPDFERKIVLDAQISDFDWPRVEQHLAAYAANPSTESSEEALLKRGCLIKDEEGQLYPTYAGLLLFGRAPQRFLPSAEIMAARYPGSQMDEPLAYAAIRGCLPDQLEQAEQFTLRHLERSFYLKDLDWQERPTLPADVVREVIVNAVAHRAYDITGDSIRLFVFADRLECYSPGRLAGHLTLDTLLTERFGRNEVIGYVLAELGWMARLGGGLKRVARRLAEEGMPAPLFEETVGGFKVTLFNRPEMGATRRPQTGAMPRRWLTQGLYARQIKAMDFVAEHGRMTLNDYIQLCPEIDPDILQRDLSSLVARDLLLRVGDKRAIYYILK